MVIFLSCPTSKLYFKKGVNAKSLKKQLLDTYNKRGAGTLQNIMWVMSIRQNLPY